MNFELIRKSGKIQWTDEQKEYILDQYINNNASMSGLGKKFSCDKDAIKKILKDNGIHIKSKKELYSRDSHFFDEIDTNEKAYWLGFFYADGCVAAPTASNPYLVELGSKDKEHLEKFKSAIKANNKVTKAIVRGCEYYQFNIQDEQLHSSLIKHGCIPQKSKILTKLPDISKEFFGDFLRGYFDGDGCLYHEKARNVFRVSFVSGSLPFLQELQHALGLDRLTIQKTGAYALSVVAQKDVYRILTLMYKNSDKQARLDRKYELYKNYLACCNLEEVML